MFAGWRAALVSSWKNVTGNKRARAQEDVPEAPRPANSTAASSAHPAKQQRAWQPSGHSAFNSVDEGWQIHKWSAGHNGHTAAQRSPACLQGLVSPQAAQGVPMEAYTQGRLELADRAAHELRNKVRRLIAPRLNGGHVAI